MKIKKSISLLGIVAILSGGVAALSGLRANHAAEHFAATAARSDRLGAMTARKVLAAKYGLEADRAGLHVVYPFGDDVPLGWLSPAKKEILGNWDFFSIGVAYSLGVDYCDTLGDELGALGASVSTKRFLPNGIFEYTLFDDGVNGWEIHATASQRSIDILTQVHGPTTSSTEFVDWAGWTRGAGESCADLRVAAVADNIAFLPVSVTALVENGVPNNVVVIARALSYDDAYALVYKLKKY